jgi:hypothetical protein
VTTDNGTFSCEVTLDTGDVCGVMIYNSKDSHSKKKHAEEDAAREALVSLQQMPGVPKSNIQNNSASSQRMVNPTSSE